MTLSDPAITAQSEPTGRTPVPANTMVGGARWPATRPSRASA